MGLLTGLFRQLTSGLRGRGYRWPMISIVRRVLPARQNPDRKLDVYWLSTGRCGTHFVHNLFRPAVNFHAIHDDGIILEDVFRAAGLWKEDPETFWQKDLSSYSGALCKILENGRFGGDVFSEFLHAIYPFGYMMHRFYAQRPDGPRLKLVHLVREPVACCRSMLKVERREAFARRPPAFVEGEDDAAKAASIWSHINTLSRQIVQRIDNTDVARTVRIEDLDLEAAIELREFLELSGLSREQIETTLADRSQKTRHSHLGRLQNATRAAGAEELMKIRKITQPLAHELGYKAESER